MKKLFAVSCLLFSVVCSHGQNVGIGTLEPMNKMQVEGSLLVNSPTKKASNMPTAAQQQTMVNATTIFVPDDSVFRIYDPGGPSANYPANVTGNAYWSGASSINVIGMEITVESMQLGSGDSILIKEVPGAATNLVAVGNNYNSTGKWIFNGNSLSIVFKSNADANVGSGFSIVVKRLYSAASPLPDVNGYVGYALFFDVKKGALRSGRTGKGYIATSSTALGYNATASGDYSTALGSGASAEGYYSFALGTGTSARGYSSTAMGDGTIAYADYATAMGSNTTAGGEYSTASGYNSSAYGAVSTAQGYNTKSHGYAGTVVGMFNDPVLSPQTAPTASTPLFVVGNGDAFNLLNNAMVVLKNGNTGIGINNPQTKLQVQGGTDASLSDNSGYLVIGNVSGTNIVIDNNEIMARSNGATTTLYLQNSGGAFEVGGSASKPGGGSWSATSDARLKQNLSPYKDGLRELLKINPVNYHYNLRSGYDTATAHVGVLAQELQTVAPYMVRSFAKDSSTYLKVDNTAMTYMLINAVKELSQQNEALKARLEKLELQVVK